MVTVRIFVADPASPGETARTALRRAEAAAGRFAGQAEIEVLPLGTEEALESGAAVEPTVVVGRLVVAAGQAPPGGHLVRAIQAALEGSL